MKITPEFLFAVFGAWCTIALLLAVAWWAWAAVRRRLARARAARTVRSGRPQ